MVPTLFEAASGKVVTESIVCIEFIDEVAALHGGSPSPPLLPPDPFERARARVAADKMNKTVTSGYYQALVRKTIARESPDGSHNVHRRLQCVPWGLSGAR